VCFAYAQKCVVYGQDKVYKRDLSREVLEMFSDSAEAVVDTLTQSAKDTINAFIEDSISTENDTTALKLNDAPEGHLCYLKQLSSANTNGGGWFVAIDSAYAEQYGGVAFSHPTAGLQWVRDGLDAGIVNVLWFGALNDSSMDATTAFNSARETAVLNGAKIFIPEGDYKISSGVASGKFYLSGGKVMTGENRYRTESARQTSNLFPAADGDTVLMISTTATPGHSKDGSGSIIEHLGLNGVTSNGDSAKVGFVSVGSQELLINDLRFRNFTRADTATAIVLRGNDIVSFENVINQYNDIDLDISWNKYGVSGADSPNGISFTNCRFLDSKLIGTKIDGIMIASFDKCDWEANWGDYTLYSTTDGVALVNVSGNTWYLTGYDVLPSRVAFNDVVGTKVVSSALVDSEGEWFWTTSGDDTLFFNTADTTTIAYGSNRNLQRPHENAPYRALVIGYGQQIHIRDPYFESGHGVGARFLDAIPFSGDAQVAFLTNINIYGGHISDQVYGSEGAPTNYPINIRSKQDFALFMYGTQIDHGPDSKPIASKDTITTAINLYGCILGNGSWPASGRPFTVLDYDSTSFTFLPGYANNWSIGKVVQFYGPMRQMDDGGFMYGVRADGMRDNQSNTAPGYHNAGTNIMSSYIQGSGTSWLGSARRTTINSYVDTLDIRLARMVDVDYTNFFWEGELLYSSTNGNSGASFRLQYWQHDDGGANLAEFRIDTLYSSQGAGNAIDSIYVRDADNGGAYITVTIDSPWTAATYYIMGETIYSRNIYPDSTIMSIRGE